VSSVDHDTAVRFRFGDCDRSIVVRSVVTAADHLCGVADISIALLDALEVPLAESLLSLNEWGIEWVIVDVVDDHLTLEVGVRRPLPDDLAEIFGDANEIVDSFFAIDLRSDALVVVLAGSLS